MRARQLAVALGLAAVVLLTITVVFGPMPSARSTALGSPRTSSAWTSQRPQQRVRPHRRPSPLGPTPTVSPDAAKPIITPTSKPSASHPPRRPDPAPSRVPTRYPPGSRGVVYLTFDDGPGPFTAKVLSILSRTGSTATFFEMGNRARAYPSLVAAVRAQGSVIGNHTYDHPNLTTLRADRLSWELANGPAARCVRPPYGASDAAVRAAIARAGARQVLWTVDTADWSLPGAGLIAQRASGPAVRSGSIVLMHDGGGDRSETVRALPAIIENLQLRGYVVRKLPYC